MASLHVTLHNGDTRTIAAADGVSVMQAIREANIDELLALCGGCCSCATCHVHVDPAWLGHLAPKSSDEHDLLEFSSSYNETSRLSCQLSVTAALDGMALTIAPEG